jgi:hypothetical protein
VHPLKLHILQKQKMGLMPIQITAVLYQLIQSIGMLSIDWINIPYKLIKPSQEGFIAR